MSRIPDDIIQKVRDYADVVEVVGRTVSLKRAGRSYKGLCPFHDEKTPSFNVNPDRGSYYCFGCQEGGDIFSFLMKIEGLTFVEAVRSLAKDAGIEVPESGGGDRGLSEQIHAANAAIAEAFMAELAQPGNPGAAYLAERGLDEASARSFRLGYAPDGWDFAVGELRKRGIPIEIGEQAGLISQRSSGGHYDRLRGRVIFPIEDARNRVIGFGGRAITAGQEPKYLNTPESPVFRKREALYGLSHALEKIRRADAVVVCEGYFDRIALCQAGVENAVATCGTSLTADHARGLQRRTRNVVLLFDADEAGQRAVERALEVLLPAGLRVSAVLLTPGDDPDTFLAREGPDALRRAVEQARPALELVIERAVAGGCDTPWAKADAVAAVAPLLALVASAVERSEHCARLALSVGSEPRHVEEAVRAAARGEDARDALPVAPRRDGPEERNLRQLARSLVEHPGLGDRIPRAELTELASAGPLTELITVLVDAAADARGIHVEELATRLSEEAQRLLRSLAAGDEPLDEAVATRTIDDTIRWLRRRKLKQQTQELTRKLREPGADPEAVLEERKRLISERKTATHPPVGHHV